MPTSSHFFSSSRRAFLRSGALGVGAIGASMLRVSVARAQCEPRTFGPLQPTDANGLRLPIGFSSRIVAVATQQPVGSSSYLWPRAPDGGAVFATGDGGWIYVANSEVAGAAGGVGALRFQSDGTIVDAYSILTGTSRNCAGGPTPWGTWLSCEETVGGRVWECDPFTPSSQGVVRPALGTFNHEACAVDPVHGQVYLTEDASNGLLYRFTPTLYPDLSSGALETAEILDPLLQGPIQPGQVRPLAWHAVAAANPPSGGAVDAARLLQAPVVTSPSGDREDPLLQAQDPDHLPVEERATRFQAASRAAGPTPFNRGEGCWFEGGSLYFATTADHRVWEVDTVAGTIEILYDFATSSDPELLAPDNVFASPTGDVIVAEDLSGSTQLVALTPSGGVEPIVEVEGQSTSELAGPCLTPDNQRLYFSSQRGPTPTGNHGVTYEVVGPFDDPPGAPGECKIVPALGGIGSVVLAAALGAGAMWRLRGRPEGPPK